ncbi:transposase [Streptomyces mirabilis]|uniref:transposase n=1 Tax=Streptomyces mirabilis TaxID=68239 RepID=UPI002931CDE7|nr:transposase [Streptomyces mirabilis]
MSQQTWTAVDDYFNGLLVEEDEALLAAAEGSGVFDQLHRILLSELNAPGELDWSRACVDGSHIRAKRGGADTAPSPVDRRKTGSKHHLICDGRGTPFKVITTAANVNDVIQTLALFAALWSACSRSPPQIEQRTCCACSRRTVIASTGKGVHLRRR